MLHEPVVGRVVLQVPVGGGHEVPGILGCLLGVAGGAVRGRYDDMYAMPVVIEGVLVGIRLERVTFGTSDDRFQEVFWYALRRYSPLESRFLQRFLGVY